MASLIDRLKFLVSKNAQQTSEQYNRAIYNWLGESIVWNPENDDSYIKRDIARTPRFIHWLIS
jgi:hypothetical protein